MTKLKLSTLFLAAASMNARAFNPTLEYGADVLHSRGSGTFVVGIEENLQGKFRARHSLGLILDSENQNGALASTQFGVLAHLTDQVFVGVFMGVAVLTHTDRVLGGNFQFIHDLELGTRSSQEINSTISLNFKHISNAGIKKPNLGRNLLGIRLRF